MRDLHLNPMQDMLRAVTRRHFFHQAGFGIGAAALTSLLKGSAFAEQAQAATTPPAVDAVNPLAPKPPHFAPKAKSIIYLFMAGAPSQVDLLDCKPKLQQYDGQNIPEEMVKGERFAFIKGTPKLLGSPYQFQKWGQSGAEISELLPHLGAIADEVAIVRSVHTTQFNHAPAQIFMNTGFQIFGRPSMGSWMTYGLGSQCRDLPGFVVLVSGENQPDGGKACWASGFLPTVYQGVEFRSKGDPVLFLTDPEGVSPEARRQSLDAIKDLNEMHLKSAGDPEIVTRIASYEMAYRMQSSVPELMDLSQEPQSIHEMYGTEPGKKSFANNCLLARRLVERGVRFVNVSWDNFSRRYQVSNEVWDTHENNFPILRDTHLPGFDQTYSALMEDLEVRGLLDETLVVVMGEMGRTPQLNPKGGRDHWTYCYSVVLAGAGIRGGTAYGASDKHAAFIKDRPAHVRDICATIYECLGIDPALPVYDRGGKPVPVAHGGRPLFDILHA